MISFRRGAWSERGKGIDIEAFSTHDWHSIVRGAKWKKAHVDR